MFRNMLKCVYMYNLSGSCAVKKSHSYPTSHLNKLKFLKPNSKVLNVQRTICVSKTDWAKLFHDYENAYAFSIVTRDSFGDKITVKSPETEVTTLEEFNNVLDQNWRISSSTEIVTAFKNVKNYCVQNDINITDKRFDKLVDGLMDRCEKLNDTELYELLTCLSELPPCETSTAHNFHDVWSCLDDICCWKLTDWDIEKMFKFANVWCKLHLAKMGDFIFVLIDRLTKKADKLTKDQLVTIYYYFNAARKRPVDFQFEFVLEKEIANMNMDEMAVVALGYFKSKTKIKLLYILEVMMQRVKENSSNIHEISLAAIIKVIRYSKPLKLVPQIQSMLDQIYPEMDRFSNLCCLHIALTGTGTQSPHIKTISKASERLVKGIADLEKTRLKDIERLLNVLSMFDFDPKTDPDVFKAAYKELHRSERVCELIQYPRCLPCALNYFSIRNIYSYELMNKVLDIEYINDVYGNRAKQLPREILTLDASIDIECPDYTGNRIPLELRRKATRWVVDYVPSYDQHKKISAADQLFLDVIDVVRDIVKDEALMKIDHIVPHFSRADIILCRDRKLGRFVQPCGFENYVLGDVMAPRKAESLEWFAIIILGWNNTIRDSSFPLGNMIMKKRQLKKLGYNTNFVTWNEFLPLSKEDRTQYILQHFKK